MKRHIEVCAKRKAGRRWNLFLISCILYILAPVCASGETSWPQFRGDAQSTGLARDSLSDSLVVLWAARVPEGVESTAAIRYGTVFVGGLDGNLYAFDFCTGALKWKYSAGGEIKASPLVADNAVFVGDGDGGFHAVDASSGKGLWTYRAGGEIISSAVASDGRVIFGSYDQFLYCLAMADGTLVWKVETEGYVHGSPALWGDRVLVAGCDGLLRMVSAAGGREVSRVELSDYVAASVAVRGGSAYAGTFGNQVLGLDLTKAKVLWRYEHPSRRFPFYASPAVTEKHVIVAGRDRMARALRPETGEVIWIRSFRSRLDASPVVAGDRVFAGTTGGRIVALDLESGEPRWEFSTGSRVLASPSVAGGRLVIGTTDGTLYCFGGEVRE